MKLLNSVPSPSLSSFPPRIEGGNPPATFSWQAWLNSCVASLSRGMQTVGFDVLRQSKRRRLVVSETVSLGEKRFLSIVEIDGLSYLIGGGTTGVSLLTQLERKADAASFSDAVAEAQRRDVCQ